MQGIAKPSHPSNTKFHSSKQVFNLKLNFIWQKAPVIKTGDCPATMYFPKDLGNHNSTRGFQWSVVSVRYIGKVLFGVAPLGSHLHRSPWFCWLHLSWSSLGSFLLFLFIYCRIQSAILLLDVIQTKLVLWFFPVLKVFQNSCINATKKRQDSLYWQFC